MKKYLMRGGVSPLDNFTPEKINSKNLIGANSGNLLYAFGVYRSLMTEDTVIDMDYYGVERSYTDADIERINEEYDAYICPLADAFRNEFAIKLTKYAYFFNHLRIPVYVIGMGLREQMIDGAGERTFSYPFDEEAKAFIKAVRGKGGMLGLRGAITGEYFKKLGFKEDEDFQVIGCPSMYMKGRHLNMRTDLKFTPDGQLDPSMNVAFNLSTKTPRTILDFLNSQMGRFPNHYAVLQNENDLRLIYYGQKYTTRFDVTDEDYPLTINNRLIQEDRARMFINIPTWLKFMEGMDLSIGSKLHGNVAAILGGCPGVLFPIDGRMQELIAYHKFPHMMPSELEKCRSIEEVLEKVDLDTYIKVQPENFDRFVSFLDKNGLDHIYKEDKERKEAPIDAKMAEIEYHNLDSILTCDRTEAVNRFNSQLGVLRKRIKKMKKEAADAAMKPAAGEKFPPIMKKINYEEITFKELFYYFRFFLKKKFSRKK